jgi:hypothetical protein
MATEDLSELEAAFTEDEVWDVIGHLPPGKAPGPDRFTDEFLQKCWGVVKADFMAAFDKLYTMCGRGFQGLNQALIVLLPKRLDAAALADYRPISLIHIFAKLVAKVLASRLAPGWIRWWIATNAPSFANGASTTTSCWCSRQPSFCTGERRRG